MATIKSEPERAAQRGGEVTRPTVLFIDDDEAATRSLVSSLKRHNATFECLTANTPRAALTLVQEKSPEVVVADLTIEPHIGPDSGLKLIAEILSFEPTTRILVLTGHDGEEFGIRSLQHGAASFLQKPVHTSHIHSLIDDAISYAQLGRRFRELSAQSESLIRIQGLSSLSPAMKPVIEAVAYAATTTQPVFLIGETGVGKGVIAHALHKASERNGPFIRFQPTFASADLTASELFGHQKGAFTGAIEHRSGLIEEANNGTLFLDEVDELPPETQILLLDVLQERRFRRLGSSKELFSSFRLITATNRTLDFIIQHKKLREDFYHRIAHCMIEIPPLRERSEDLPFLAEEFLRHVVDRENLAVQGFTPQAIARLGSYEWPGNIRELQARVESAVLRANYRKKRFVEPDDLALNKKRLAPASTGLSFRERVRQYEIQLIKEALHARDNNQTKAARDLKLDRVTMRRILKRADDYN